MAFFAKEVVAYKFLLDFGGALGDPPDIRARFELIAKEF
jgi:hypothetical protein